MCISAFEITLSFVSNVFLFSWALVHVYTHLCLCFLISFHFIYRESVWSGCSRIFSIRLFVAFIRIASNRQFELKCRGAVSKVNVFLPLEILMNGFWVLGSPSINFTELDLNFLLFFFVCIVDIEWDTDTMIKWWWETVRKNPYEKTKSYQTLSKIEDGGEKVNIFHSLLQTIYLASII